MDLPAKEEGQGVLCRLFIVNRHNSFQLGQHLLFFFRLQFIGLRDIFTLFKTGDAKTNGLATFGTQLFDTVLGFTGNQRTTSPLHYILQKVYGVHKKTIKCRIWGKGADRPRMNYPAASGKNQSSYFFVTPADAGVTSRCKLRGITPKVIKSVTSLSQPPHPC